MKKNINIFFASLVASSISLTQAQANEGKYVKRIPTHKSECKICNQETEINHDKKVNTIIYKVSYNPGYDFPVTVREKTTFKEVYNEKFSILPSF